MTNIASTAEFFPRDKQALGRQLIKWNLDQEIGFREAEEGQIVVFAKGGATIWPQEWTPGGDDLFEEFGISAFLYEVAQPGQTVRTHDSGGNRGVYISAHTVASETA